MGAYRRGGKSLDRVPREAFTKLTFDKDRYETRQLAIWISEGGTSQTYRRASAKSPGQASATVFKEQQGRRGWRRVSKAAAVIIERRAERQWVQITGRVLILLKIFVFPWGEMRWEATGDF